jgi:DNA polymerase elongation subunit (family B)
MIYKDFQEINRFFVPIPQDDGNILYTEYHADNIIAGDTDSGYFKLPSTFDQLSNEEVVEICDEICEITNASFDEYCSRVFNMPKERKGSIAADREAVSDKSLFLTKKRYIMHIVNMEGKWVDELKIKGVEIIKSDTAPIVKKMLMELVSMILDDRTRTEVMNRIKGMKKEFYAAEIKDLASPSGCKTLLKAQKQLEETGTMKGAHYSARAAIFYNSMCSDRDTFVRAGDKVGIVYIRHPQSKYLAYPIDATELPKWIDDIIIDYDAEWEKADKKLTNYLTSMGWDMVSRNNQTKKDLFGF